MEGMSRREKREKLIAAQKQLSHMPRPKKPKHIPAQYVTVEKTPLEVEVKANPESGAYDFSLKSR
jgi:hypothetical protein